MDMKTDWAFVTLTGEQHSLRLLELHEMNKKEKYFLIHSQAQFL